MRKIMLLYFVLGLFLLLQSCNSIKSLFTDPPTQAIEQPQPFIMNIPDSLAGTLPASVNGWEPYLVSPGVLVWFPAPVKPAPVYIDQSKTKNSGNTKIKDVGNQELKKSGNQDSFNDNKRQGQKSGNTDQDTKLKDAGNTTEETAESWLNFGSVTALIFGLFILAMLIRWLSPTAKNFLSTWFKIP